MRNLASALLSLALLGSGGLAPAEGANLPPVSSPGVPEVVYTPMLPAPAVRPAPRTPTPSAPANLPAAADRPASVVYTPMPSRLVVRPTPAVDTPTVSLPANRPAPVVNTPIGSPPAARPGPVVYAPIVSPPANQPAPIAFAPPSARAEAATLAPAAPASPRLFGLATDVGLPDGANLGLVLRPAAWVRLHGAVGTNSASLGFRGGATAIPHWFWHFGPSVTVEAGYCRVGDVNSVLRTFFQIPSWMTDYAQQAGYTYYNVHLGLEFGRGNVTGFLHAGGSYVDGTVRTPKPVTIATGTTGSSIDPAELILAQDAKIRVFTMSAKAGLIVFFGGP